MKRSDKERTSRRVPLENTASQDEIRAAIDNLSTADLIRLTEFAKWRVRGLGRKSLGRDHEDLLIEAISVTLEDKRSWNKRVSFTTHLLGAIQSISNNWARRFDENEPFLETDIDTALHSAENRKELSEYGAHSPIQESEIISRQMSTNHERIINDLFENDPIINLIICHLKEGMKLPEIRNKYKIDSNSFEAAIKRLRRKLDQLYKESRENCDA